MNRQEARRVKSEILAEILCGLNDEQLAAATDTEGPVVMSAGAGTGKTKTLIARIAYLLTPISGGGLGVEPDSILCTTFTNKAGKEMLDRLQPLFDDLRERGTIPKEGSPLWIGTFHAISMRILRYVTAKIGLKDNFTIADEDAAKELMNAAADRAFVNVPEYKENQAQIRSTLRLSIESAKNLCLTPEIIFATRNLGVLDSGLHAFTGANGEAFYQAYEFYQKSLQRSNLLDFADIINRMTMLINEDREVARLWQTRFRHFMVDELQDANPAQMRWLTALSANGQYPDLGDGDIPPWNRVRMQRFPEPTMAVAGDEDQSIYMFRGSDVTSITQFDNWFDHVRWHKLETNYRCQPNVLLAANSLIENNKERLGKVLVPASANPPAEKLKVFQGDWNDTMDAIVGRIAGVNEDAPKDSIAILCRTRNLAQEMTNCLKAVGITVDLRGAVNWRASRAVRDAMALVTVFVNPDHDLAFKRVRKLIKGAGESSFDKITDYADALQISVFSISRQVGEGKIPEEQLSIPKAGRTALGHFFKGWDRATDAILGQKLNGSDACQLLMRETGLYDKISNDLDAQNNLRILYGEARHFTGLPELVEKFQLGSEDPDHDANNVIEVMTIHASKGLEFDHVFVPGLVQGIIPHMPHYGSSEVMTDADKQEERRLFFVALTRGRKSVTMSAPSRGPMRTSKAGQDYMPRMEMSDFLFEIPKKLIDYEIIKPKPVAQTEANANGGVRNEHGDNHPGGFVRTSDRNAARFSQPVLNNAGQGNGQKIQAPATPQVPASALLVSKAAAQHVFEKSLALLDAFRAKNPAKIMDETTQWNVLVHLSGKDGLKEADILPFKADFATRFDQERIVAPVKEPCAQSELNF